MCCHSHVKNVFRKVNFIKFQVTVKMSDNTKFKFLPKLNDIEVLTRSEIAGSVAGLLIVELSRTIRAKAQDSQIRELIQTCLTDTVKMLDDLSKLAVLLSNQNERKTLIATSNSHGDAGSPLLQANQGCVQVKLSKSCKSIKQVPLTTLY